MRRRKRKPWVEGGGGSLHFLFPVPLFVLPSTRLSTQAIVFFDCNYNPFLLF